MTPRSRLLVALALCGVAAGLLAGQPALIASAAPAALLAVTGVERPPRVRLDMTAARTAMVEGEDVDVRVRVRVAGAADRVDVAVACGEGMEVRGGARACRPEAGELELDLRARAHHWGTHALGPAVVRVWSHGSGRVAEHVAEDVLHLRVRPAGERLRRLVVPRSTHAATGSRPSRARGSGLEFSDLRAFEPGDSARHINWRASSRAGMLLLTQRHPERMGEIVVVPDMSADVGGSDAHVVDDVVRLAWSFAEMHLAARDRVGVVGLEEGVWWLPSGHGRRQLMLVEQALIGTRARESFDWISAEAFDRRVLPAHALVLFISPLLERRSLERVLELRGRGRDVSVVALDPLAYLPASHSREERVARRLWAGTHAAQRAILRERGMTVAQWWPGKPIELVVREVRAWRGSRAGRFA